MTRTSLKIGIAACVLSAANACAFLGTPAGGATHAQNASAGKEASERRAAETERMFRELDYASRYAR